jgi:hypothetical protein
LVYSIFIRRRKKRGKKYASEKRGPRFTFPPFLLEIPKSSYIFKSQNRSSISFA